MQSRAVCTGERLFRGHAILGSAPVCGTRTASLDRHACPSSGVLAGAHQCACDCNIAPSTSVRPERHSRSPNFATGVCSSKPVAPQGLPRSFTRSVPHNSGSSRSSCRAPNNCGVTLDRRGSIRRLDSCGSNCAPDIVLRSVPPGIEGCDRHRALVTSVDEHLLELFGYLGGNVLSFEVVVYL